MNRSTLICTIQDEKDNDQQYVHSFVLRNIKLQVNSSYYHARSVAPLFRAIHGLSADQSATYLGSSVNVAESLRLQRYEQERKIKLEVWDEGCPNGLLLGSAELLVDSFHKESELVEGVQLFYDAIHVATVSFVLQLRKEILCKTLDEVMFVNFKVQFSKQVSEVGRIEPYVWLRVGSTVKRTCVMEGFPYIEWRQNFHFNIRNKEVVVQVKDKDDRANEYIGRAKVSFYNFNLVGIKVLTLKDFTDREVGRFLFTICRTENIELQRMRRQNEERKKTIAQEHRLKCLRDKQDVHLPPQVTLYGISAVFQHQIENNYRLRVSTSQFHYLTDLSEIAQSQVVWRCFIKLHSAQRQQVRIQFVREGLRVEQCDFLSELLRLGSDTSEDEEKKAQVLIFNNDGVSVGTLRMMFTYQRFDFQKYLQGHQIPSACSRVQEQVEQSVLLSRIFCRIKQVLDLNDCKKLAICCDGQRVFQTTLTLGWYAFECQQQVRFIATQNQFSVMLCQESGHTFAEGRLSNLSFTGKRQLKLFRGSELVAQLNLVLANWEEEHAQKAKSKKIVMKRLYIDNISFEASLPSSLPNIFLLAELGSAATRTQMIKTSTFFRKDFSFEISNQKSVLLSLKVCNGNEVSCIGQSNLKLNEVFCEQKQKKKVKLTDHSGREVGRLSFDYESLDFRYQQSLFNNSKYSPTTAKPSKIFSIFKNYKKNLFVLKKQPRFGDKIYDYKSSSTLQNSILSYSFGKGWRFPREQEYLLSRESRAIQLFPKSQSLQFKSDFRSKSQLHSLKGTMCGQRVQEQLARLRREERELILKLGMKRTDKLRRTKVLKSKALKQLVI